MDLGAMPPVMLDDVGGFGAPLPVAADEPSAVRNDAPSPLPPSRQLAASYEHVPAAPPPKPRPLHVLPPPPPVLPDGIERPHRNPPPVPHYDEYDPRYPPPSVRYRQRGIGDDTPASASNLLGLALLAVPTGGYLGYRYAGLLGVVGGALGAGAAVNAIRAGQNFWGPQGPDARSEAIVSATYAVLGLAVGGYMIYRGHGSKHGKGEAKPNPPKRERPALPNAKKDWL